MEMEQDHHHYAISDLRHLITGTMPHFPTIPPQQPPSDPFSGHRNLNQFDMMIMGPHGGLHDFRIDSTTPSAAATPAFSAVDVDTGGDGGYGRWPRQETLTLLEIRSRLDHKFKEANQKGPFWDDVSRIMSEEHGYQRSGKKCREKFENLYKYYKKTKEGKAGRQDGKHYRFFRQLEAIYGETSNQTSIQENNLIGNTFQFHSPKNTTTPQPNQESFHSQKVYDESFSISNSSEFDTSSSDNKGRSWKMKIKEFIDLQMKKLMERQEAWMEKLIKTIERKEEERLLREEEWRKVENVRIEREHKFWAKERAWIEARDVALMEALQKLNGKELMVDDSWSEMEISKLINLRMDTELGFQKSGGGEEIMWDEIATRMGCFGYNRNSKVCKEKWENIDNFMKKSKKQRKENYYNDFLHSEINEQGAETGRRIQVDGSSPSSSNVGNGVHESCFRYLMGDGENLWENYGVNKVDKGEN